MLDVWHAAACSASAALFSLLLAWTGGRVSEVLAVRANSFQLDRNLVSLHTLKRRKPHVREVPIAPGLMTAIDRHFGLTRTPARSRDRDTAVFGPSHG